MGLRITVSIIVNLKRPGSQFLTGTGKTEEIIRTAKKLETECIVFSDSLSPSQQRNWEAFSELCVIDRQEVILDIFAARAVTKEAALQVGLARMEYSLPRLTRAWTHLSRQRGGTRGTRGEGETQLETDRRIVLRKISRMKKELLTVKKTRATQRKKRLRKPVITASIVGYTNAGKSSLLKALTGADVFIENKLFATLDPTVKRMELPSGRDLLLTDTVGFIRDLPHDLIDAFKSTLEEAVYADFLIHVLDSSNPEINEHFRTTISVLKELGVVKKEIITVFNKIDLAKESLLPPLLEENHSPAVSLSAETGEGLEDLVRIMDEIATRELGIADFHFPSDRHDLTAYLHRHGKVIKEKYENNYIDVRAEIPDKIKHKLDKFVKK